jgi:glycine/D-amino acid oxidase-like deaminating enzyme
MHDVGSQTSPRAAGMVSCVRKSELMIDLIKLAAQRIRNFTKETGQSLNWVHSGSLKIARRPQDAEVIVSDVARGRRSGLDVERISAVEAHRLNPLLQPDGIQLLCAWATTCTLIRGRSRSALRTLRKQAAQG